MAKRPRSHQLADEAVRAFEKALPSRWVARQKVPDYRIDLEIEIFDVDDGSTGLLFLAQVKGTDTSTGRSISLKRDYLEDIASYDSTAILVRYFARDGRLFWRWVGDLLAEFESDHASQTFHFTDAHHFDEKAISAIELALIAERYCNFIDPGAAIPVSFDLSHLPVRKRLAFERELVLLRTGGSGILPVFRGKPFESAMFRCFVQQEESQLTIGSRHRMDVLFHADDEPSRTVSKLIYSLAWMLRLNRLAQQAERLAGWIGTRGIAANHRALAYEVVICFHDLEQEKDLALLNGLHHMQDEFYVGTLLYLKHRDDGEGQDADIAFMRAALAESQAQGPNYEGVILYSMANAMRSLSLLDALSLYNKARKKKPEYLEIPYFLREVAGTLFLLGKYQKSHKVYCRWCSVTDLAKSDHLLVGDAALFGGDPLEAEKHFRISESSDDSLISIESSAKLWLIENWDPALGMPETIGELCNVFNTGIKEAQSGEHSKALARFLMCAFRNLNDHEAWINAALCCHNIGNPDLYATVLAVGFNALGRNLLDAMVAEFEKREMPDEFFEFVHAAFANFDTQDPFHQTFRPRAVGAASHFDVIGRVD